MAWSWASRAAGLTVVSGGSLGLALAPILTSSFGDVDITFVPMFAHEKDLVMVRRAKIDSVH